MADVIAGVHKAFIDVETTGLDHNRDRIIEVAVAVYGGAGAEVAVFSEVVCPVEHALACFRREQHNAVPLAEVEGAAGPEPVAARLHEFLAQFDRAWLTLYAYNAPFDKGFLGHAPWAFGAAGYEWGPCVMRTAAEHMRTRWRPLLATAQHFGVKSAGTAHRALADARLAAGVYFAVNGRA